jgi:hypothetical protein
MSCSTRACLQEDRTMYQALECCAEDAIGPGGSWAAVLDSGLVNNLGEPCLPGLNCLPACPPTGRPSVRVYCNQGLPHTVFVFERLTRHWRAVCLLYCVPLI